LNRTGRNRSQIQTPAYHVLAGLVGMAAGAAPLAGGGYDVATWANAALVFAALLLAFVVSRSAAPPPTTVLAATGLAGLGAVTLLSSHWADDRSAALVDGARWLAYAVAVCAVAAAAPDRGTRRVLHLAVVTTVTATAAYVEARMLAGAGESLFNTGRLTNPVGYANGQAAVLLMGFWLAFGVAERATRPAIGALAAAAATMQLGLVVLTATRSAIPAAIAAVVCVMALSRGRVRRGWLLAICVAGAAVAVPAGLDVYDAPHIAPPPDDVTRPAAMWVLVGSSCVGLIWFGVLSGLSRQGASARARLTRASTLALVLLATGGAAVGMVAVGNPVARLDNAWDSFTALRNPPADQSRFASVGGNRYDYWRVALKEFRQRPVGGLGGGNYVQGYYSLRRTAEYIRQPHSVELQVLSELGLVGASWLLLLLAAIAAAAWRGLRPRRGEATAATIGAAGALITWTIQTSVDWLHLLPGVTLIALVALVLARPEPPELRLAAVPDPSPLSAIGRRRVGEVAARALPVGLAFLAVCASIAGLRVMLADRYRERAKDELARPARALRDTAESLRYDRWAADTYYLRAAALARRGDYAAARAALLVVAHREPRNFLPWVLLGDLASRRGLPDVALAAYRRAAERNPRDPAMAALVRAERATSP